MRITQRKGDIAVTKAIAIFTGMNFDVSLPITESAAYDLVVDDSGGLKRVQVKYTSGKEIDLRRIHSNSRGYVVKKTSPNAYDWLFVVTDDACYLIKSCLSGRRSVNISTLTKVKV